jgi:hypothetical protein
MMLNATFSNISQKTTDLSQVTDKLYHRMLYTSRFELTTSVMIGTDCIGSCKSNYHTIRGHDGPYDKRDDFNFPIVNSSFTFQQHLDMECITQLIRYSRTCGSHQDFLDRGLLLTRKLLNQGFLLVKLKSSLRTFYGRHHDLA